jgi:hypothetical protein
MASNKVSVQELFTFNKGLPEGQRAVKLSVPGEMERVKALYMASLPSAKKAVRESESREYEVFLLMDAEGRDGVFGVWQSFGRTSGRGRGGLAATDTHQLATLAGLESGQLFRVITVLVEDSE